jgi:BASS family bile acid:Na+ symporter
MLLCNLVMVIATWAFLDRRSALTVGYCSGGRHNALLMAVLPATADPDIFLFIAAVQFPIYIIPALLQPLYRRLLPR